MAKICIACGMPMQSYEDYALGNPDKNYCRHCMCQDGSMQSYEEKLESLSDFLIQTRGIHKEAAREIAKTNMAQLPAWRDHK